MILSKNTEILIGHANIKYYKGIGYNVNKGDRVLIDIIDLRKGTPIKIDVKCDICGYENRIYLQKYYMNFDKYNYYSCFKCCGEKIKITNNKKYGVDNPSQSELIKNKKKETTLKNYGVENPSQSESIKKLKCETMMKNYGVEYVFQSNELQKNMKKTKLEKYGDENYHNIEKSKITNLEKYCFENVSQSDIIKKRKCETSLINYGVEYPVKLDIIKQKSKKTCLKKYGVEHAMQNKNIFIKSFLTSNKIHKYKNTNIFYQGSYEKDFLDKYLDKIEIDKIDKIKYIFENKVKYYYPDFYYKKLNLIIEIKSDYTLINELYKNLAKQKSCIEQGYNFIFIVNKDYSIFENVVF